MKTIRKIFTSILAVIMMLSIIPINAFASENSGQLSDSIYWNYNDNTKTLTISGTGEIPATKDFRNIPWYDYLNEIEIVNISNGITAISDTIRRLQAIKTIKLPNTLIAIYNESIEMCDSLQNINIPKTVTYIGNYAFSDCNNLKSFTIDGDLNGKTEKFYDANNTSDIRTGEYYFVRDGVLFLNCKYIGGYHLDETQNQLVKYPSGRSDDTYIVPDDVSTILSGVFEEGMKLKRLVIPSSVKSMLLSAISYSRYFDWKEIKPIDVIFQHDHYPIETREKPYYGFTWSLANLFEGSRVIVKNEEVKKEFESYYNMDDISNSFIYDYDHIKRVQIIVEPNPTTSFSVDKTTFNFSLDDFVKNYDPVTGELLNYPNETNPMNDYFKYNYAQVNVTRAPMDTTDSIKYTIKSQKINPIGVNFSRYALDVESINDSNGNPIKDNTGKPIQAIRFYPETASKEGIVTIDEFGRIHPTGATGTAIVTVSSGDMSQDITINVTCNHLLTQVRGGQRNTCDSVGNTSGTACALCGVTLSGLETLPALGHDFELIPAKEPDGCENGYNAYYKCKRCGRTSGYKEIPGLGHDFSIYHKAKPATCTEDGNNEYYECSRCGEWDRRYIDTVIDRLGHDIDPTTGKCRRCSYVDTDLVPSTTNPNTSQNTTVTPSKNNTTQTTTTKNNTTKNNTTKNNTKSNTTTSYTQPTQAQTSLNTTNTVTKTNKPKNAKIKKIKGNKKAVAITWSKVSGVKGYQVQVATDKKFKKNKKTVTIKKQKKTSTTVKKLKTKKKYYVRIRTYKVVNGKKVYSSWSSVKSVKTK